MPNKPKTNYSTPADEINPKDTFQTPAYALDPLLPYIQQFNRVWESAHGAGYLVRALTCAGKTVIASDLATGYDALRKPPRNDPSGKCLPQPVYDIEITNVPFSKKFLWISKRCTWGIPFALLIPSDVLFAGKMVQPLIKRYHLEMLVPDKRINYCTPERGWHGSSAQMHTSWLTYGLNIGRLITFVEIKPRPEEPLTHNLLDWKPDRPNQLRIFRPGSL